MPGYQALQSFYQGALVHHHRSRPVTEAVMIYSLLASTSLLIWVEYGTLPGIYGAVVSFTVAGLVQTVWLRLRALQFV